MTDFRFIDEERLILGESPVWDDERELLYYIDYRSNVLRSYRFQDSQLTELRLDINPSCIALTGGDELICGAMDGKVYLISADGGTRVFSKPFDFRGTRFNDGKPGPDGRYYLGSKGPGMSGAFYRVDHDGSVSILFDGVGNSNGIAFSSDEKTLYYCDSEKRCIEAFSFDAEKGEVFDRRTVIELNYPDGCVFDGMTIDSEGLLWVAVWNSFDVLRIDPVEKRMIERHRLPVPRVTCPCFAGAGLDILAVTTASFATDTKAYPYAGKTALCSFGAAGLPAHRFIKVEE